MARRLDGNGLVVETLMKAIIARANGPEGVRTKYQLDVIHQETIEGLRWSNSMFYLRVGKL